MTTYLTISEASEATDRSAVTLRRYLKKGRFPGAYQDESDPNRPWMLPLDELEAIEGLHIRAHSPGDGGGSTPLAVRVAVAEAVAKERGAALDRIERLAAALEAQATAVTALVASHPMTDPPSPQED